MNRYQSMRSWLLEWHLGWYAIRVCSRWFRDCTKVEHNFLPINYRTIFDAKKGQKRRRSLHRTIWPRIMRMKGENSRKVGTLDVVRGERAVKHHSLSWSALRHDQAGCPAETLKRPTRNIKDIIHESNPQSWVLERQWLVTCMGLASCRVVSGTPYRVLHFVSYSLCGTAISSSQSLDHLLLSVPNPSRSTHSVHVQQ